MMYYLFSFFDIGLSIKQAIRTLCGRLAAVLYNFIVDVYNVFMYISRAEILEEEFIQGIYNRVGMILGIFMAFKLTFSLIQSLVDPNKMSDEKKGFAGIIKRSLIAIVLLGITPSIFDFAYDLQNKIVGSENNGNNLIYKVIVGDTETEGSATFGHTIATDFFFSFFVENEPYKLNEGLEIVYPDNMPTVEVLNYENLKKNIRTGKYDFGAAVDYLSLTQGGQYIIEWNEIFSIGAAVVVIYMLIIYCIQVAVRVIQLAYLQLIAPVPILSYINDSEGTFKNWVNQCVSTYLDLFLRLAVIYFVIVVSTQILNVFNDVDGVLQESTGLTPDSPYLIWVKIFLVLGLLLFGKKVPDLLKELFPIKSGAGKFSFGLNPKKEVWQPLKSTPVVGWGMNKVGKGAKWLGKKAVVNPISKGWDSHKKKRAARKAGNHEFDETYDKFKKGRNLYEKYEVNKNPEDPNRGYENDLNFANAFSGSYKNSYLDLVKAKHKASETEKEFNDAAHKLQVAINSGDEGRIASARANYLNAEKANKAAQKDYDNAKAVHEVMKKKNAKDAAKEDAYNYYKGNKSSVFGGSGYDDGENSNNNGNNNGSGNNNNNGNDNGSGNNNDSGNGNNNDRDYEEEYGDNGEGGYF